MPTRAAALVLGCGMGAAVAGGNDEAAARFPQNAGMALFATYCVGCHGQDATGCGSSARLYRPRPANLTASTRSPEYKASIIRNGGESMGRSPFMPPWVGQLDDDQIRLVIEFLGTLSPKPSPEC